MNFATQTRDAAKNEITNLNFQKKEMIKNIDFAIDNGDKNDEEIWIAEINKMNMKIEGVWDVYYAMEHVIKTIEQAEHLAKYGTVVR
tara:strand:+ start:4767 stop:5027 length:261 start_codon:yes stop_codon:yes gene_type:complete